LLTKTEARRELPAIYDACRPLRPGLLSQSDEWWGCVLGDRLQWKGGGELYVVVADADEAAGTGPGFAIYRLQAGVSGGRWTEQVFAFAATDPVVEAQLWRFLLDIDLVVTVHVEGRPLDCALRWWFADPRQLRVTKVADYLWLRLLDVERCLSARAYSVDDSLAVAVTDPFRPENDGTYVIDGTKQTCVRSAAEPDLAIGVDDLGGIYLGQTRPSALAAAGRVTASTAGAIARADALFSWPVGPDCLTRF
jgi:predicted acetyltransferase